MLRGRLGLVAFGGLGGGLFGDGSRVFKQGYGEAAWHAVDERAGFGEERGEVLGTRLRDVLCGAVVYVGRELFEQCRELELGEEGAACGVVHGLRSHGFNRIFDGHRSVDRDELFREQDVVAVILQRLAVSLLFDFVGAVERGLDGAELLDQLDRSLVADAGRTGNVVD